MATQTTTAAQDALVRPAAPALVVLVVSVAAFLASLDLFIVNIAFAQIRASFGNADLSAMS